MVHFVGLVVFVHNQAGCGAKVTRSESMTIEVGLHLEDGAPTCRTYATVVPPFTFATVCSLRIP